MIFTLQKGLCTLLGIGYFRPLSATWGSFATGIALYFLWPTLTIPVKLAITIMTFFVGWWAASAVEKQTKLHDPHFIVIDEAAGIMITTMLLTQNHWHWILAFVLFRLFDILKLWPASFFDKRRGGFAIMFDDVLMGVVSLGVVEVVLKILA